MTTPAERLFSAEAAFLRAEHEIERLLDALYGDWQDFEHAPIGEISVFGVTPSPAAVAALHMGGFKFVIEHDHPSKEYVRCCCRMRPS